MGKTFTKGALLTLAFMPVVSYHPISEQQIQCPAIIGTSVPSRTISSRHFKPNYIIVDNKVEAIPAGIPNELETISSLLEIGNILLKDSRNESPEELQAMRSYFKSKYKKVQE
ncbi:MAG: hypothetical protein KAJ10_13445 [Thermodesulfovibrionia bacterium]|nr:hypothetical protein [Thermodesulfovibrionia bacterium]